MINHIWDRLYNISCRAVPAMVHNIPFVAVGNEIGEKGFIIEARHINVSEDYRVQIDYAGNGISYLFFYKKFIRNAQIPKQVLDLMQQIPPKGIYGMQTIIYSETMVPRIFLEPLKDVKGMPHLAKAVISHVKNKLGKSQKKWIRLDTIAIEKVPTKFFNPLTGPLLVAFDNGCGQNGFVMEIDEISTTMGISIKYKGKLHSYVFIVNNLFVARSDIPDEVLKVINEIPKKGWMEIQTTTELGPSPMVKQVWGQKVSIKHCTDCPLFVSELACDYCNHPDLESRTILYLSMKSKKIPKQCPLIRGGLTLELDVHAQVAKR